MIRRLLAVVCLLLVMGAAVYTNGVWRHVPPALATWMGAPSIPGVSAGAHPSATHPAGASFATHRASWTQTAAPRPADGAPGVELNGISWRGDRSVAVVNHHPLNLGDAVEGYVLRQVTQTFIELVGRGERVFLYTNGTHRVLPAQEAAPP